MSRGMCVCVYRVMRHVDLIPFYGYCNNTVHRDERNPTNIFVLFITHHLFFCISLSAQLSFHAKPRSKVKLQLRRMSREKMLSLHMGKSVCQEDL